MTLLTRIIAAALIGIIALSLVKSYKPEYSVLLSLSCAVIILVALLPHISILVSYIKNIMSLSETGEECIKIFFRCVMICEICSFAKSFCRDSSNHLIYTSLDLSEKILVVFVSLPLFEAVFDIIRGYIGG